MINITFVSTTFTWQDMLYTCYSRGTYIFRKIIGYILGKLQRKSVHWALLGVSHLNHNISIENLSEKLQAT